MADIRLVVFDLAGTTVMDAGQVPAAFASALGDHGIEVTAGQLSDVRGASKRQAILQFVPPGDGQVERTAAVYESFRRHLRALYRDGVQPIPGAERVFRFLRERGVRVALNTGFDRGLTTLLLDALAWGDHTVDAVVCGDDVPRGRPAPDLIRRAMALTQIDDAWMVANVGDTALDLAAGHSAGVRWNIGVLSGAHDRARLESVPHTHLLDSVADLEALWETSAR